jgi:hypothetical protein
MGHSPLYDKFIAIKDARVADESKTICLNDPYLVQIDKYEEEGYPWNFSWGDGGYKLPKDMYDGYVRGHDALKKHGWIMSQSCNSHLTTRTPRYGEVLRLLRVQRRRLSEHLRRRAQQPGEHGQHRVCRLYRLPAQVRHAAR